MKLTVDLSNDIEQYEELTSEEQTILDATAVEAVQLAWDYLRSVRNYHLERSDWTQTPDAPLTVEQKDEWCIYRQILRDLPENTIDPNNPTWPEPPNHNL